MRVDGLIVGVASFILCGLFHVAVVKTEYYFTKNCWPLFLAMGGICTTASLFAQNAETSCILAVIGFLSFWSIRELFEQENRVRKGWFPKHPNRHLGRWEVRTEEKN